MNYITGVAAPGPRCDRVRTIAFAKDAITLIAASGARHRHPVDLAFLGAI